MIEEQLQPSKMLGYTQLYLDFLAGTGTARSFYSVQSMEATAIALDRCSFERTTIQEILRRQNSTYGGAAPATAAIERMTDARTVYVFAGQQAGWFGGPMMSLIKALTAVKAALALADRLHRPVVPIFWIAGDDHDFIEANHTYFLNRQGECQRTEYAPQPDSPLPMGKVRLNNTTALDDSFASMSDALGETEFTRPFVELLRKCYSPADTFVTAFGKLMASLTAEYGLVLFSPNDPAVKALARPFFREIIMRQDELHSLFVERNRQLQAAGYHLQVQKQGGAAHLFVELDGRTPLHRAGHDFTVGDRTLTRSELLDLLEAEPERFSPDAIVRPLLQSWLFPTVAQIGGPSEIAYFAQGNALFDLFDRPTPTHLARPTLILVEKRFAKLMSEHAISFEEIAGDIEQLVNRILAKSFPEDIERRFNDLRAEIRRQFDLFTEQSLGFDPSLRNFADQTHGKIDFALKTFEGKLFAAHKKRSTDTREKIYRLQTALYPNSAFQDRSLNVGNFISRHGFAVVSWIYDALDPFAPGPKLVSFSEEKLA